MSDNLPPGVTTSMLPGCSRKEELIERILEESDNDEGYRQWLDQDKEAKADFEEYCFLHFWGTLKEDCLGLLHPDDMATIDPEDPLLGRDDLWTLFLWTALDKPRLDILIESYLQSHKDGFYDWVFK